MSIPPHGLCEALFGRISGQEGCGVIIGLIQPKRMVRRVYSALKQDKAGLLLGYLITLSLTVVFVNWEATPYNPCYAFMQSIEVFGILLPAYLINNWFSRHWAKNRIVNFLLRLVVLFGVSLLIVRLNIEFTPYNVAFVLFRVTKIFLTITAAMSIRMLFMRYQLRG